MPTQENKTKAERLETRWSYQQLRTQILSAFELQKPGVAHEKELPQVLDVGPFGAKALECLRATEADERQYEYGTYIMYDADRRTMHMKKGLTQGNEKKVVHNTTEKISRKAVERVLPSLTHQQRTALRNSRSFFTVDAPEAPDMFRLEPLLFAVTDSFLGGIHSHPDGTPFSAGDLSQMLRSSFLKVALLGSGEEVFALLTTRETLWLTQAEANERFARWERLTLQRWEEATRLPDVQKRFQENQKAEMHALSSRIAEGLIRTVAPKYHLAYYRGKDPKSLRRVV